MVLDTFSLTSPWETPFLEIKEPHEWAEPIEKEKERELEAEEVSILIQTDSDGDSESDSQGKEQEQTLLSEGSEASAHQPNLPLLFHLKI